MLDLFSKLKTLP